MPRPDVRRCSEPECRAIIFWAETPYGARQPIDAAPTPDGNIVVVNHTYADGRTKYIAFALGKLDEERRQGIERMGLHTRHAHHTTCPKAEKFPQVMELTFRPIERWPGGLTTVRKVSPFRAPYSATLELLDRELNQLRAERVVLQVALGERDIRLDGRPYGACAAEPPGIILAFHSARHKLDLQYAVDTYGSWEDNLRAIALALEALRKVDRYGVTKTGAQYQGWRRLTAGDGDDPSVRGAELIREHGGVTNALRATHPDHGGSHEDFLAVQAVRSG